MFHFVFASSPPPLIYLDIFAFIASPFTPPPFPPKCLAAMLPPPPAARPPPMLPDASCRQLMLHTMPHADALPRHAFAPAHAAPDFALTSPFC